MVKGVTLWKIADASYDNGKLYPQIFEANKPMLRSADLIYPGQVLRIPPLEGEEAPEPAAEETPAADPAPEAESAPEEKADDSPTGMV